MRNRVGGALGAAAKRHTHTTARLCAGVGGAGWERAVEEWSGVEIQRRKRLCTHYVEEQVLGAEVGGISMSARLVRPTGMCQIRLRTDGQGH